MATNTELATAPALELRPLEREILAEEILPFAGTLGDPAARERYMNLDQAARAGTVPPELVPALATMLELMLQTRRIRQRHGPDAEQALTELFYRTPRGSGLRQASGEVNAALETLRGQTIDKLTVLSGPGRHTLVVSADRCRLTIKFDPAGVRIENVEVGG